MNFTEQTLFPALISAILLSTFTCVIAFFSKIEYADNTSNSSTGENMLPFYYLSVTTNLIMGFILVFSTKNKEDFDIKYPFLKGPTFLLVLLIFSGIAAVFKLLSPVQGSYPLIGDILPVLSGLLGCVVFLDRWIQASETQMTLPAFFTAILAFEQPVGFFCLFAGIIHLFFSQVLFL